MYGNLEHLEQRLARNTQPTHRLTQDTSAPRTHVSGMNLSLQTADQGSSPVRVHLSEDEHAAGIGKDKAPRETATSWVCKVFHMIN